MPYLLSRLFCLERDVPIGQLADSEPSRSPRLLDLEHPFPNTVRQEPPTDHMTEGDQENAGRDDDQKDDSVTSEVASALVPDVDMFLLDVPAPSQTAASL